MIRKILMSVLTILLAVLTYFTISNGVSIGSFKALGLKGLKEQDSQIQSKVETASSLTSSEYPSKLSELNQNAKNLLSKKEEYTDLTTYSTDDQIQAANELQEYEVEYLWAEVGKYATKEGIKIKMDISTASSGGQSADGRKMYDLNFTAEGAYIGIALFLSDLQDDSFLEFKIENFALAKGESTENLKATFVVKDVPIKIDNLSANTSTDSDTTGTATNTTNNTTNNTTSQTNTTNNNVSNTTR
mgnify:CR=1 FL=1